VLRRMLFLVSVPVFSTVGLAVATGEADLAPLGVDRRISTATTNEYYPDVVWNATTNESLVVWEDWRNPSRGAEIYGRRVGPDGLPLASDFRISTATADEETPQVAWSQTSNQFLVVWVDSRNDGTRGKEIFGRRLSGAGVPLGSDFRISTSTFSEYAPAVTWNATANEYLVVWTDLRNDPARGYEVFGRRVSGAGAPLGSDFRISSSTATEYDPDVVWNETDNQYLVVWEDNRSSGTRGAEIYGRRVGATGSLLGADFRISTSVGEEYYPTVAWNPADNQYLVVWEDNRNYATRGAEIFGRRVANTGSVLATDFRISTAITNEYYPVVLWNETAEHYVVVWQDGRDAPTRGSDIYARRVGSGGGLIGIDVRISAATYNEKNPAMTWNATTNEYLVIWEDNRAFGTRGREVYGRRVAGDPAP
jgi:hypothetical protein